MKLSKMALTLALVPALSQVASAEAPLEHGAPAEVEIANQAAIKNERAFLASAGPEWKRIDDGAYAARASNGISYTVFHGAAGKDSVVRDLWRELAQLEAKKHSSIQQERDGALSREQSILESLRQLEEPDANLDAGSASYVCVPFGAVSTFEVGFYGTLVYGRITSTLGYDDWGFPIPIGAAYARVEATDLSTGYTLSAYSYDWVGQELSVSLNTSNNWDCGMRTVQRVQGCGSFYEVRREASCSSLPAYSEVVTQY
ncbi:hypothetical protein [Myxococcus sp. RHSTA-1-4]|uniref:hypothetical protein n=1 Tax=Myxococcus sp. RHSTA-1-4 TaxID=2874601 RepID=UPI001CBDA8FC|nr:hypothetical protein [Myxococcus sp. RHSTA-1-4]MBZ4420910.1 hypothetical protein [Myxococcus sp. RHSTA-1-4]